MGQTHTFGEEWYRSGGAATARSKSLAQPECKDKTDSQESILCFGNDDMPCWRGREGPSPSPRVAGGIAVGAKENHTNFRDPIQRWWCYRDRGTGDVLEP